MNKTEILNIVSEPSKHIQIENIDGKDSIVYSSKIEPDIENNILFKPTELVGKDKAVLMKREELEEWTFGMIEDDL